MPAEYLIAALALMTMAFAIGFALWSRRRTLERMEDDTRPKSSLAKDGPGPQPFR